ncbi:MAG: lipopolysaccharide heptosyltransferase II [Candidatus Omnitrophica bacterium 4484_70.1]|nr:MAG: lipopolysaccharide heptosyltransferase II [Candidatus Omnitrophica bacterium 4484_70.1]
MKILIFNPFGIGDVLFTTPLIRNIKDNFPSAVLTYICNKRTYPLIKKNIFIDKIYIFEKDEWRQEFTISRQKLLRKFLELFTKIKKERFDVVFDLSFNPKYGFFFKLVGIKKRIGYSFKHRGIFLTHKVNLPDGYRDYPVAKYHLSLLQFLGVKGKDYKFDLFLGEEEIKEACRYLEKLGVDKKKPIIGVCPGSGDSWQELAYFKRWPKENFVRLVDILKEEFNTEVIIFGSPSEIPLGNFLVSQTRFKPINLCGKITLEEFQSLLSLCEVVITNDGGPFHISQALGKNIIAFFGPVDDNVYGPYSSERNCIVLKKEFKCRPCYQAFKFKGCSYDKRCLREITVEEVVRAVKTMLS